MARRRDRLDAEQKACYFRQGGGERCSERRVVLLERRQMKRSMLICDSRECSSWARRTGNAIVGQMGGMCGQLRERWRVLSRAVLVARRIVSWAT